MRFVGDSSHEGLTPSPSGSPLAFFSLVFALSVPFWLIGAVTERQVLPGLPVGALMTVCPVVAASILVYREQGTAGVVELLKRSFDYGRVRAKGWYVPVVLVMPAVVVVAYGLMRVRGLPLPTPRLPLLAPAMLLAFLVTGLAEELGWSGYVTDPLQDRRNALGAGILVGLVWAAWHIVPLLQAQRPPAWIAWWSLYTVGNRVLTVWLYNNTGKSVFAAALFHAMQNASWQLFPNHGSHWDPRLTGPIVAAVATVVAVVWGPRTLALPRSFTFNP